MTPRNVVLIFGKRKNAVDKHGQQFDSPEDKTDFRRVFALTKSHYPADQNH